MSDSITAYYDREKDRQDSYVQSVKEKFEQRSQTGIKKYNTTLERKELINYRVYGSQQVKAIIKLKKRETLRRVLHLP